MSSTTSSARPSPASRIYAVPAAFILWTSYLAVLQSFETAQAEEQYDADKERELAKPYLMRNIEVGGTTLPVSPVTVLLFAFVAIMMYRGVTQSTTATARHILLDDHSDESRKRLEGMKGEIGNDKSKFIAAAKKYSKCPSGKQAGGSLGKFAQGSMVPPFDAVVFDPKTKVGVVVGPVHTNFGWHLILVEERDEVEYYREK